MSLLRLLGGALLAYGTPVFLFIRRNFQQDFHRSAGLLGVVLYQGFAVFILSILLRKAITPLTWSASFSMVMLFSSFSLFSRHLSEQEARRWLYDYQLVSANQFLLARLIYYWGLLLLLNLLNFVWMFLLFKRLSFQAEVFLVVMVLGSMGFAGILTLLSSLCMQANNPSTLLAVLGLPLMLPYIWSMTHLLHGSLQGLEWAALQSYIGYLLGISVISWLLNAILFPYVWQE